MGWQVELESAKHEGLAGRALGVQQGLAAFPSSHTLWPFCKASDTLAPLADVPMVTQLSDGARTPARARQSPNPVPFTHRAGRGEAFGKIPEFSLL